MKRKILFSILFVLLLITITGCGNNAGKNTGKVNNKEEDISVNSDNMINVDNLYFENLNDGEIDNTDNGKRIKYDDYSIIISHQKNKSIEELVEEKKITFNSSKEINKINWQVYDFSGNVISNIYMYEKDDGTYNVTFAYDKDKNVEIDNIIDSFMNKVIFK